MYESLLYPARLKTPSKLLVMRRFLQTPNKLGILQTSKINFDGPLKGLLRFQLLSQISNWFCERHMDERVAP